MRDIALPHSREAEQAVLGGLLLAPSRWSDVAEIVRAEDFYLTAHRNLFAEISLRAAAGEAPDAVTLSDCSSVDRELVLDLAAGTPSAANIGTYARVVADRARRRDLIRLGGELCERASGTESLATVLDWAGKEVLGVDAPRSGGPRASDAIAREWVERQAEREDGSTGLKTGFADFDSATHGLHPGELVYLAARPAMGKTTLALDIALNVAREGRPVLFFSLEMTAVDLFDRLIAQRSLVDVHTLRGGRLSEDQARRASEAASELSRLPLAIDDSPALSTIAIRARARRHLQRHGLALLVVDYLGLIRGQGENRTREVGNASRDLKAIAKELRVPVLCLAQLNRAVESRNNRRPRLSDLREAGDVEQDADLVAFIYRDEVYDDQTSDRGLAEIIIAKQRQGPCRTVVLTFDGATGRFLNADVESQRAWSTRRLWTPSARSAFDDL